MSYILFCSTYQLLRRNDIIHIVYYVMDVTLVNTMNEDTNTTNTMNNETQYAYPYWMEAEQTVINEHRIYNYEMMFFIEKLQQEGPEVVPPKKPKTSLNTIIKNKRTQEHNLDLHGYLCRNLVDLSQPVQCPTVSEQIQKQGQLFLEDTITFLQAGCTLVKAENAKLLKTYIEYGIWLNCAFELHYLEKITGKITDTWKQWLEMHVDIKESYARKLREISKLLCNYPRFQYLGLSFSEVYRRRREIQNMLTINATAEAYWKKI